MEEATCHHQGQLLHGRRRLGAPGAASWAAGRDLAGPGRGRPYRFEAPIPDQMRPGPTPGIQRRVPGARLRALTNKAGMCFRFSGMMLATPLSIKDLDPLRPERQPDSPRPADSRQGALPRFRITQVSNE